MDELEQSIRADSGLLRQPPAVDVQGCSMEQLVCVMNADGAQSAHIIV